MLTLYQKALKPHSKGVQTPEKASSQMGNSSSFPQKFETAKKTSTLTFNENEPDLPSELFQLGNLKNLDISQNRLRTVSPNFQSFQNLKLLNLDKNKLTELNLNLPTLEKLFVSDNRLTSIRINECKNLKQLNVSNNQLTVCELELPNLVSLDISSNQITALSSFDQCVKLESIECSSNQIQSLKTFQINVKSLKLCHNRITELPIDFLLNQSLVFIDVEGNSVNLTRLNGYEEYMARRKDRKDQFLRQ